MKSMIFFFSDLRKLEKAMVSQTVYVVDFIVHEYNVQWLPVLFFLFSFCVKYCFKERIYNVFGVLNGLGANYTTIL